MARVSLSVEDHVARVTLTRGDKMNALDSAMIDALLEAGQSVLDSEARAVVLAGEGKSFCAGLDVASFAGLAGSDPTQWLMDRSHGDANRMQEVALIWRRVPVPGIAAPDTRLAVMERRWGLIPDMGGMVLLPRLVRGDVLRYLTYSARPVEAVQGERWGLVTQIADNPLDAAVDLAHQIAGQSPSAIRAAKRLIDIAETAPRAEVLLRESAEQADLIGKPDQMEVIAARMQGRAPVFK